MVINALSDVWSDLHPAARNPARITKANKDFSKRLEFKEIEFPVKVRDLHKIKKKNYCTSISDFGYERKRKYLIYLSGKCSEYKHVDFLTEGKKGKRRYVLIKDFKTLVCDHTVHRERKYFCSYCLHVLMVNKGL